MPERHCPPSPSRRSCWQTGWQSCKLGNNGRLAVRCQSTPWKLVYQATVVNPIGTSFSKDLLSRTLTVRDYPSLVLRVEMSSMARWKGSHWRKEFLTFLRGTHTIFTLPSWKSSFPSSGPACQPAPSQSVITWGFTGSWFSVGICLTEPVHPIRCLLAPTPGLGN